MAEGDVIDNKGKSPSFVAGLDYFKNFNKVMDLIIIYQDSEQYDKWFNSLETYFHLTAPYMKGEHGEELKKDFLKIRRRIMSIYYITSRRELNPLQYMTNLRPIITELEEKLFRYAQPAINKFSGSEDDEFDEDEFIEEVS